MTPYRFRVLLGAELALAAAVGFLLLGQPSLWSDEVISAYVAELGWSDLFDVIRSTEAMHGFYYIVLKLWISLAGTSEFALRTPSVVFFVVGVLALVFVGRTLFTDRIALIAGLLLTLNPFMLTYAREARGYAMVTMFVTLSTLLFIRLMLANRIESRLLVLYTAVGVLSVYAHAWALFVLLVHAGTAVAVRAFRSKLWWMVGSWVGMAIAVSPLLYFFVSSSGDQVLWIPSVGIGEFVLHFRRLTGGRVLMLLYVIGALVALGACYFRERGRGRHSWSVGMLTAWALIPPVLTFLLSLWVPLFLSRYLIVSLPGLVLLVAVGFEAIRPKWIGYGMLGVIVMLSTVSGIPSNTSSYEDWRSATAFILDEAEASDVIMFYAPYVFTSYLYYEERSGSTMKPEVVRYELGVIDQPDSRVDALVAAMGERGDRRVWVVLSHDAAGGGSAIEQRLSMIRRLESRTVFAGNIRVIELVPARG